MKVIRSVFYVCWAVLGSMPDGVYGQALSIQQIVDKVDSIRLRNTVEVLSGEITLPSDTTRIVSRGSEAGRALARNYILERLHDFGLQAWPDSFVLVAGELQGANIIAQQSGWYDSTLEVIIGAHFDCDQKNGIGPGADDNASGCAAVLEAARLLSTEKLPVTVIYAFWDLEEWGKIGSDVYARRASARGDSILGVLNLDLIGWDGDSDQVGEVHFQSPFARSQQLADSIVWVSQHYVTGLSCINPWQTVTGSDHQSFYLHGYSAVLLTEESEGGDVNPYFGSVNDRISHFNFVTFLGLTRAAVASIAWMAGAPGTSSVNTRGSNLPSQFMLCQNHPNPFNPSTTIRYGLPNRSHMMLAVYNTLGQQVAQLLNGEMEAGYHEVRFDGTGLSSGVYFYRMQAGAYAVTKTLLLVR